MSHFVKQQTVEVDVRLCFYLCVNNTKLIVKIKTVGLCRAAVIASGGLSILSPAPHFFLFSFGFIFLTTLSFTSLQQKIAGKIVVIMFHNTI